MSIPTNKAKLTEERILRCARAEFLQKGFAGASTRSIAQQAGMTTGAIYRYFPDKNALFEALVDPVIEGFRERFEAVAGEQLEQLSTRQSMPDYPAVERTLRLFTDYVYANFEAFDLLVNGSAGSSRADYVEALIRREIDETRVYMQAMEHWNLPLPEALDRYLPLLIKQSYRQLLEMVATRMTQEEAQQYMQLVTPFLYAGWSALMKGAHDE